MSKESREAGHEIWIYLSSPVRELPAYLHARWEAWRTATPRLGPPWWFLVFIAASAATWALALWMFGVSAPIGLAFHLLDRGASTLTLGLAAMALILFRQASNSRESPLKSVNQQVLRAVTASVGVWFVAAVGHFLTEAGLETKTWEGTMLALQVPLVAAVALAAPWAARSRAHGWVIFALAFAAMVPLTLAPMERLRLQGCWLLLMHVVPAALWIGGVAGLVLVATRAIVTKAIDQDLREVAAVFSQMALVAAVTVAVSGIALGFGWLGARPVTAFLVTSHGQLLLSKLVALILLLAVGAVHRGLSLKKLAQDEPNARVLVVLALAELAVMGIAMTLGVSRELA